MKRNLAMILIGLLISVIGYAQESDSVASGEIRDGVYTNEYFAFTYQLPQGFEDASEVIRNAKTPDGTSFLFCADQHGSVVRGRILVAADSTLHYRSSLTVVDYARRASRAMSSNGGVAKEGPLPLSIGTEHYVRSNFAETENGITLFKASVFAKLRGHFLFWTFVAPSRNEVDHYVKSLENIHYGRYHTEPIPPDAWLNPKPESKPVMRIRVSRGIAEGQLIKKVAPEYPFQALQKRIEGDVVLKVLIDVHGRVREVEFISGNPMLKRAAMDAVMKYAYRPYELNGQPVEVDTQLVIQFRLAASDSSK